MRGAMAAIAACLATLGLSGPGQATIIKQYSYVGNPFDDFSMAPTPFVPGDRVTGSFTIDCGAVSPGGDCSSLAGADYASSILAFSFSAGPILITEQSILQTVQFFFSTSAQMDIVDVAIDLTSGVSPNRAQIQVNSGGVEFGAVESPGALALAGCCGEWSVLTIPEPATLTLLAFGLLGLGFATRRHRHGGGQAGAAASASAIIGTGARGSEEIGYPAP